MIPVAITLADVHALSYAQRKALRTLLDLPSSAPLRAMHAALTGRKVSLGQMLWMIDLCMDGESTHEAPPTPVPLVPRQHPLCTLFDPAELRLLARKLDVAYAYRADNQIAADIEAVALHNAWTVDTLHLLLHTRAMPQFSQTKEIIQ